MELQVFKRVWIEGVFGADAGHAGARCGGCCGREIGERSHRIPANSESAAGSPDGDQIQSVSGGWKECARRVVSDDPLAGGIRLRFVLNSLWWVVRPLLVAARYEWALANS